MANDILLVIDNDTIKKYNKYYFKVHDKAHKEPIAAPYHESINAWMIMQRPMMNALKQRWKEFIKWCVEQQGYSNLRIEKCEISQMIYYGNNRSHDIDNTVPKFILDGLVESGMIIDDDFKHVRKLTLSCGVDVERPRTELLFHIVDENNENNKEE